MPIQYRTRAPQTSDRQSQPEPQMTDADDSIVLSDLVRTGEASRLRRRGAMRLDHASIFNPAASNQGQGQRQRSPGSWDPPSVIRVRSPTWVGAVESGSEDEDTVWSQRETDYDMNVQAEPATATTDGRRVEPESEKEREVFEHILFCGGEEEDEDWGDRPLLPAWEPSPLPLFPAPPSSPRSRSKYSPRKSRKKNNGCGALIHMHASPRRRQGVWMAKSEAMDSVIALDSSYFDRKAVVKMLRSACGCIREGVGCAICGNTLGTRYKPCQAAAEGLFNSRKRTPGPLHPEGPQYWHAHTPSNAHSHSNRHPRLNSLPSSHAASMSSSPSSSSYYVYTFFSANVTSSPSFTFPPHLPRHHHAHPPTARSRSRSQSQLQSQYLPTDPPGMTSTSYDPAFFDRVMTQSPTPIWEEGAESGDMEVEPERQTEPAPSARQVGGRRYGATYLVGPASGAGMGVGPRGISVAVGMGNVGDGEENLDLDGVGIAEPNSPDKLGEGISLPLPER